MSNIDTVIHVNNRRVSLIAEMTSTSFSWFMFDSQTISSFTTRLFLMLSKWFEYILSPSAYNFTCKVVLHLMVVQFKARARVLNKILESCWNTSICMTWCWSLISCATRAIIHASTWLFECRRVHRLLTNIGTNPENIFNLDLLYWRKLVASCIYIRHFL